MFLRGMRITYTGDQGDKSSSFFPSILFSKKIKAVTHVEKNVGNRILLFTLSTTAAHGLRIPVPAFKKSCSSSGRYLTVISDDSVRCTHVVLLVFLFSPEKKNITVGVLNKKKNTDKKQ